MRKSVALVLVLLLVGEIEAAQTVYIEPGFQSGDRNALSDRYGIVKLGTLPGLSCCQPIYEMELKFLEFGHVAYSFGGGVRCPVRAEKYVLGANVFYDLQTGKFQNYHQAGFGFEVLSPCVDWRVNVYLPIIRRHKKGPDTIIDFGGGQTLRCRSNEETYRGFDTGIGVTLIDHPSFYLYSTADLYYHHLEHKKHLVGFHSRSRLELSNGAYMEFRYHTDTTFKTGYAFRWGINMSLYGCNKPKRRWEKQQILRRDLINYKFLTCDSNF